ADAAPAHFAPRALGRKLARAVLEVGLGLEHLEDAAGADLRASDLAPALGDLVDWRVELREIRNEDDELPNRELPRLHRTRAGIDDHRGAGGDHQIDRAGIKRLPRVEFERRAQALAARPHEAAVLLLLLGEGLNDLDRRHSPLDERIDAALALAHLAGDADDLAIEQRDQR